jgi:FixJ family two-component response regulator
MDDREQIAVVDDDESVRESLPDLLRSFGYDVVAFASAEAFLETAEIDEIDCLILDVAMPGLSGPELQKELTRRGHRLPVVFITAHPLERQWSDLLKHGAVARLLKPFSEDAIRDAVALALERG